MWKRATTVPAALLAVAGTVAVGGGQPLPDDGPPQPTGHERMVTALREIIDRTDQDNTWLGDRRAREQRRHLESLPADAGAGERWISHLELGISELHLGREAEAIDNLSRAYELLPEISDQLKPQWVALTIFELGMAYLRSGETQNCCLRNAPESCIVPIRGAGLHTDPTGSRRAVELFSEVLRRVPASSAMHFKARWLLNIASMTIGDYPEGVPEAWRIPPGVFGTEEAFPRFANISPQLGLNSYNLYGSAVVDDFDNDGHLDIFTTTFDIEDHPHLFHNNGDGTFTDVATGAGLTGLYGGINTVQADYDNDGHVDLYVLRGAWMSVSGRQPNSLIRNNGDGTFTDVTFDAGLGEAHYPTQTGSWADYDNDGDVDLYVGNEHSPAIRAPCQLFRNNGDGTFTDVAAEAGVQNLRYVKGVVWGDFDGDRWPDLYASTMGGPNRLYRNNGDGTFTDVAPRLGVAGPRDSFPVWFWDFDNDGVLDLYVPSYRGGKDDVAAVAASYLGVNVGVDMPHLYRGNGRGGFDDVAARSNLTKFLLPMGANFGDVDNDGWLDIYLGTGYPDYESLTPNVMYRNVEGRSFVDVTFAGGFGHLQKGHSVAFADLDHDGDQDIFEQMGGIFRGDRFGDVLYENPGFGNHWIAVRLVGVRSNRSAIGARIRVQVVENGRTRSIYKHVNSGGSFGANPLRQTIGLGRAEQIEMLEVYWPTTDVTQTFRDVPMDTILRIVEDVDAPQLIPHETLRLGGG